ncbi:MAG: tRNA uridine-5-carboxymethylaminomethyl(34) synthesis enzyme MnmG [Verrucomicrobiota bacterium]|nr:tRNA uridine-5-carboxymethylaminomethyl(34) synthesis enzyme MnmG [Verrucomicrobiota bacterium]
MIQNTKSSVIVVVGAGHAGCEAALASARMGVSTLLITQGRNAVAKMSCNPAVGGIAKSHLVFELDALGGEIAANSDHTGIQFRVLNTSKGPAVRANRVQCDKDAYSRRMLAVLDRQQNLSVLEAEATGVTVKNGRLCGIRLSDRTELNCHAAVFTPGTFLNGMIYIGHAAQSGGRIAEKSSVDLAIAIRGLGIQTARLKTGTPPRLKKDTLDYSKMQIQQGMIPPPMFSWKAGHDPALFHVEQFDPALRPWPPGSDQIPCYLTHTTIETHTIVHDNLTRSALYGGLITGIGVRYCPSIEDKVVKFADKQAHHVFIEPEGRFTDLVYPNGLSNSLPPEIQADMIHSVPGLEQAEIIIPGYAIEYDFFHPTQLNPTLETKALENLYFAGQINGTTGYEEAAAQGFVAGVNAALKVLGCPPFVLGRNDAYIGVLIDDLVTKGTDEPYRMFTSRAERRLILRQDNARFRLRPFAESLGIVPESYVKETRSLENQIIEGLDRLRSTRRDGQLLSDLLRRPEIRYQYLGIADAGMSNLVIEQIEIALKYEGYIKQEFTWAEKSAELEKARIPPDTDYWTMPALRHEAREKLSRIRPTTLGQASRMPGITPADVSILSVLIKRSS